LAGFSGTYSKTNRGFGKCSIDNRKSPGLTSWRDTKRQVTLLITGLVPKSGWRRPKVYETTLLQKLKFLAVSGMIPGGFFGKKLLRICFIADNEQ
jgi:hypothetical protein